MSKKKEFSKFFIAALKRTAQNVYPLVRRKNKIKEQMEDLQRELEDIQVQIDGYQYSISQATGGYTTEDLITRTVTETGKVDKDGKPIKMVQYVLTYPETVIPTEETTENKSEETISSEVSSEEPEVDVDELPDMEESVIEEPIQEASAWSVI